MESCQVHEPTMFHLHQTNPRMNSPYLASELCGDETEISFGAVICRADTVFRWVPGWACQDAGTDTREALMIIIVPGSVANHGKSLPHRIDTARSLSCLVSTDDLSGKLGA